MYAWAVFEAYISGVLEELYSVRPELLKSNEQLAFRDAVEHRERLVEHLIGLHLTTKMGQMNLSELLKYIEDRLNADMPSEPKRRLAEFYLLRTLVAHGTGVVRGHQRQTIPPEVKLQGDQLRLTKQYLDRMIQTLARAVMQLEKHVDRKFLAGKESAAHAA